MFKDLFSFGSKPSGSAFARVADADTKINEARGKIEAIKIATAAKHEEAAKLKQAAEEAHEQLDNAHAALDNVHAILG